MAHNRSELEFETPDTANGNGDIVEEATMTEEQFQSAQRKLKLKEMELQNEAKKQFAETQKETQETQKQIRATQAAQQEYYIQAARAQAALANYLEAKLGNIAFD